MRSEWIAPSEPHPQLGLADAVREGLACKQKSLPSKFFYDAEGSRLFEQICELPEYYLTRAEAEILENEASHLALGHPKIQTLVELGSGSALKTEIILRAFEADGRDLRYLPIDVSQAALEESIDRLGSRHPNLEIRPALAEYETGLAEIHKLGLGPTLTIWLGSSIGNLDRESAAAFLAGFAESMSVEDRMLVGIDLRKDRAILESAYNDRRGVTARFDMNLLTRINRELGGQFDLSQFAHRVFYDEVSGSVESSLESLIAQSVRIGDLDLEIHFESGERIHTEDSFKYSPDEIDDLCSAAGLELERRFLDREERFSLNLLQPALSSA